MPDGVERNGAGARALARMRQLGWYLLFLAVPTIAVAAWFVSLAPSPEGLRASAYLYSVPSYYVTGLLALDALVPLLAFAWLRLAFPLIGALWLTYLVADIIVFNLYRFHLNPFLIQMVILDFRTIGLPAGLLAAAALGFAGIVALNVWMWRRAARPTGNIAAPAFFAAAGLLLAFNQATHVWADYYRREEITRNTPFFPLFYPLTAHNRAASLSAAAPLLFPPEFGAGEAGGGGGIIAYPLKAPACVTPERPPSILMVTLESWQADMLSREVMPNMRAFADGAWDFRTHVSGGNATVPAMFSQIYGLHGTYYEAFRASQASHPSLLTTELDRAGYRQRVYTSSEIRRYALKTLLFSRVAEADFHLADGSGPVADDARLVGELSASLRDPAQNTAPRFDYVFLTSSHFNYRYPEGEAVFTPVATNKSAQITDPQTDPRPLKNDYRNSLHYIDRLLGDLLAALKESGRHDDTIVILTGDHAEEFNENGEGYWGHGSNYTRWQTHVPFVFKPAGPVAPRVETRMSLHQDIAPSLMTMALGCPADAIGDYANGRLLTDLPEHRPTVLSSYMTSAYLIDGGIYEKVLVGKNYSWDDIRAEPAPADPQAIREMIEAERRFFSARPAG